MSHNPIVIKEGAFIVSDAHYSHLRPELFYLIQDIHSQKIIPTQLIFMGDIFDALFGSIAFTCKQNSEIIALINDISTTLEVIYLEGNHDFNLKNIFPKAKVFSIKDQPVEAVYKDKKVYLAHGDFGGEFMYKVYTSLIRNAFVLFLLKYIDIFSNHAILKKLDAYLSQKNDCKEFKNFKEFIEERLAKKYDCDYFIEGHFHQNTQFDTAHFHYINLGAFACNQRYFIVKSAQDIELLEEKNSPREI
ncbi:UDP-2,3-diacylglucosamine diphosphatase [Sulfurimonas autotrophica]|uniref:Metallophosphoesterase n=1 Tax=Sulfurimonas autotrophica (strain ATCC BAA-671 / DSM 16294 / JCM 11897 / OK10) TaxID=563040 RepID=E0UPZ7_SULAO|nr:metallophosphoesterase [Sulfurimonas autotrophica]ADN08672.1 metallophosphoesterase [Sulfurimonas autotrophica DSM 16294]